ncbi:MAG: type II 3-dehydroquinate dehydratase [Microcella pacifica]|uniref:3-dehydroquinate dehydratase n=1 Tax=Microcella pacifica TaxID=2591847 RepID=A0A9E5MHU3_9MICO|nr:type II 3-dehydroquinate dehydratase [Microcella pacifica]MBR21314.1 type II 3-dehydroquinate dehydratase [Leifsonia sp.]NHF61983.1 type II 3-dehydroquinate dehydratase [Microcella pacifica]
MTFDRVLVLNGPNLNRLGTREPEIYGTASLEDVRAQLASRAGAVEIDLRQTNDEATLIGWLHEAVDARTPVILNPAAFTHYSYALRDAVALVTERGVPVIEVHLSNPHAREEFRHTSVVSAVATGVIAGFGTQSYQLALDTILRSS